MIELFIHFWNQGDLMALFCTMLGLAVPVVYFASVISEIIRRS